MLRGILEESGDTPARHYVEHFDGTSADLAVSALALSYRTDDDAIALLETMAAISGNVLVIELMPPSGQATVHDAEHELLAVARTGVPQREVRDLVALASQVRLTLRRTTSLG